MTTTKTEAKVQTKINLVKYAGEYWITLASCTNVRDTEGYSGLASVKSAIRTFVVKQDSSKYVAFRGEKQLKNIVLENIANPLFNADEFEGTRMGLISFDMLDEINERFTVAKEFVKEVDKFMSTAKDYINKDKSRSDLGTHEETGFSTGRSAILRQLRLELSHIDEQLEAYHENREKVLSAINALETLTPVTTMIRG